MSALKKIFTQKQNEPIKLEKPSEENVKKVKLTFFESGYGSSKQAQGNNIVFKACLQEVYMDFKGKCREDELLQRELNAPYIDEKGRQQIELKKRMTSKGLMEESIKKLDDKINNFKNDIVEVRRNPEKYGLDPDKKPKAQFYIGLFVLIPITFYLLVFYMSASFSAFFKIFDTTGLAAAIFDGKALSKSIDGGWLEGIFIGTIPFAFMGLGYLIHMFLKSKHWTTYLKIAVLYAVTFIFDAILAYQIEQKIYDIEKTPDSLEFNLQIAFETVEFWGIIFAGFVVYIIWGLVFDFIMKEYENFDAIKSFIRSKKADIKNCEKNVQNEMEKLNPLKEEISGIEGKINDLQRTIDGFIFPDKQYLTYHTEYVKGWFLAITDNFDGRKRREELLNNCVEIEKEHLESHNVHHDLNEGRLYKLIN
jgi:small basic protein